MSPFHFIFRSSPIRHSHRQIHSQSFSDSTTTKWVRDRGLDHAVEKEKHLKPMINIKNLIKSEPSKSLPISIITQNRHSLNIPTRPIDFIRKYPSIFEEFRPGGIGIHPHVRLTAGVLDLDSEEQLMYQSQTYKQQVADRLLKLLMLCRTNRIPLTLLESLKWDLGLPQDYEQSIVPEFPDYFRIVGAKNSAPEPEDSGVLEVVCWNGELATSAIEKKTMKVDSGYTKGMPIAFPVQFSGGLDIDKKLKKWIDEWQKLPYTSPYENAAHLLPKTDESDKWAVAVLHEFLHILVPKKTEKDNVLGFGEYLGIRSRFKRALLNHPGMFYISSKIDTHTVVLWEGYKRGLLVESHPLMSMRNQYIHLMHSLKEDSNKTVSVPGGSRSAQKKKQQSGNSKGKSEGEEEDEEEEDEEDEEEEEGSLSDAEMEDEDENEEDYRKSVVSDRVRRRENNLNGEGHIRKPERVRSAGKQSGKTREKVAPGVSRRTGNQDDHNVGASSREISLSDAEIEDEDENEKDYRKGDASDRGRRREKHLNGDGCIRKPERVRSAGKHSGNTSEKVSPRVSRRTGNKDDLVGARSRENEDENEKDYRKGAASDRGRRREKYLNGDGYIRKPERVRSAGKHSGNTSEKFSPRVSGRMGNKDDHNVGASSRENEDENEKDYRKGAASDRGRRREKHLNGDGYIRKPERLWSAGKHSGNTSEKVSPRVSRRTGNKDDHNVGASLREKLNGFKSSRQRSPPGRGHRQA